MSNPIQDSVVSIQDLQDKETTIQDFDSVTVGAEITVETATDKDAVVSLDEVNNDDDFVLREDIDISKKEVKKTNLDKTLKRKNLWQVLFGVGSIGGAVFNLCSATLGAGTLSIPSSVKMTGWALGIILLVLGTFLSIFTVDLMIIVRQTTGYASYESQAERFFGKVALLVANILIVFFCMGTAIGYVIAIRDIFTNVVSFNVLPSWLNNSYLLTSLFWAFLMCPLSCLKSMDNLKFSSFAGIIGVTYVVITTIILCTQHFSFDELPSIPAFNWSFDIVRAIPIMLFAFSSQVNVYEIQTALGLQKEKKMKVVNRCSIPISGLIYTLMGVAGYWTYKDSISGNILLNFATTPDAYVIVAFFAISVTIVMAFPLNIFPTRFTIISIFWGTKAAETPAKTRAELFRHYFISVVLCVICLAVGLTVDDLSIVFSLTGGIASSLLCFAFPGICCLYLDMKKKLKLSLLLKLSCWLLVIAAVAIGILSIITLFV